MASMTKKEEATVSSDSEDAKPAAVASDKTEKAVENRPSGLAALRVSLGRLSTESSTTNEEKALIAALQKEVVDLKAAVEALTAKVEALETKVP